MIWTLPSLLLLMVVLHQRWRMRSIGQSAWKGGGFGMFSDVQRCSVAAVAWASAEGDRELALRLEPSPLLSKATIIPTARNLQSWGEQLVATTWQRCGSSAHELMPGRDAEVVRLARVTLHRLAIDFDGRNGVYAATEHELYTLPGRRIMVDR